jgi:hypothetical protein
LKVKLAGDRIVSPQQISYLLTFLETMKTIHKLSSVLALAVLMLFPLASWAQPFGGGTGSLGDPYKIATKAHFLALMDDVAKGTLYSGAYFMQVEDIDLGGTTIALTNEGLSATYTGNYCTLSNFKLEISETVANVGLFNVLENTIFDKVTITPPSGKTLDALKDFKFISNAENVALRDVKVDVDLGHG